MCEEMSKIQAENAEISQENKELISKLGSKASNRKLSRGSEGSLDVKRKQSIEIVYDNENKDQPTTKYIVNLPSDKISEEDDGEGEDDGGG